MTYQVRVTDPDGTNSIILDKADNINYHKVINSPSEGISFDIPTADGKTQYVTKTKYWELWDTASNERVNRGPIHGISDASDPVTKVSGPGRSQLLLDHYQTQLTTFYYPIPRLIDDLRYENVAAGPSTKTFVWDGDTGTQEIWFPNTVTVDSDQYMQYYGLSKQTKDNAIDDNDGYILPGMEKPSNTYYTTNSYWSGTDVVDSLIIDLGASFTISKVSLLFPWWGGIQRLNNRGYTFQLDYCASGDDVNDIDPLDWNLLYENTEGTTVTDPGNRWMFYMGADPGQTSIERSVYNPVFLDIGDINARYFRVVITGTKAWFGSVYDGDAPIDRWGHQCDPESTDDDSAPTTSAAYPKMKNKKISDRVLEPQNDCYAGIVEFGAYTTLLERNEISGLVKQRIKNDNKQITYFHTADPDETITVGNFRKFEPGGFFKKVTIDYSGASASYTRFFDNDCDNCYPTFAFGVADDFNSLIYRTTDTSGTPTISTPRFARNLTMRGSPTAVVTEVDAWPSKADPLSWGGNYTFNTVTGDTAVINFRGGSFTWWATIPDGQPGAEVDIEIREKDDDTGNWSTWTLLDTITLPSNIVSEVVYDIPYNTTLNEGTSYEIRLTNMDGNYMSVDSFGGWWEGSMTDFNEDNERFSLQFPNDWKQIYDSRFTNGSMYKTNKALNGFSGSFQGDRLQVYSAKGRYHGSLTIIMEYHSLTAPSEYDPTDTHRIFIPGGDVVDGSYTVDLNTGSKGHEVPGVLIFDSDTLTGWKFGEAGDEMDALPWGRYSFAIKAPHTGTYMADLTQEDSDQFVARCNDCNPESDGTEEINRFIYIDGISTHERASLTSNWKIEKHLDIIASVGEALELEWDIGELGLTVRPRIGIDTDIILMEGVDTVISSEIVEDGSKMATQLISSGADIEGLPLFAIVENRKNRELMGRTVQQVQDYRSVADYFTLIGVTRAELVRRREPEYRVNVTHIGYKYGLNPGDSFMTKKKTKSPMRVRINTLTMTQSKNSGIQYSLECIKWPPIV